MVDHDCPLIASLSRYVSKLILPFFIILSKLGVSANNKASGLSPSIPKNINFEVSCNLENATRSAYEEALKDQKGCVLLSPGCSSQDEFNDYQDRGNMFTKIVNNLEVKC